MDVPSIPELISSLRSAFRKADFDRVEKSLLEREESLAATVKSDFSEVLTLKEIEKIELEAKCASLCKEVDALRSRSALLEERAKEAADGFRVYSVEQGKKQREARETSDLLEANVERLVLETSAAEGEADKYRSLCRELEEQVLAGEEERKVLSSREKGALGRVEEMKREERGFMEKILQLQAENRNLECARTAAEAEAALWKKKYGEVEAMSLRLVEENMSLKAKHRQMSQEIGSERNASGKPIKDEVFEDVKIRQLLKVEPEDSDVKVVAAARAGKGTVPPAVIEIIDSGDEMETKGHDCLTQDMARTLDTGGGGGTEKFSKELCLDLQDDGPAMADVPSSRENGLSTSTPKRKRSSRVVMSDSESVDDEHGIPNEEVKRGRVNETKVSLSSPRSCSPANSSGDVSKQELTTPSRRRLVSLSQCREVKDRRNVISPRGTATPILSSTSRCNDVARNRGTVSCRLQYPAENIEDHGVQGDEAVESSESESEGENLGGFIVNESSASDNESSLDDVPEQELSSDSSIDQILAKIGRGKSSIKWEYEADMLASFGKDPVICMKAVCALYRQQTADEKSVKETLLINNRGFSKIDAKRGSSIAEFLTDGNPYGPLTKSVKDLQEYDPTGVEYCYMIATRYSRQLFMSYQNKEDPYFCPI